MVLAELSIWPMDKGESVGAYVGRVLDLIDRSGLPYKLGPMGTCVEGELPQILDLVGRCHALLEKDSNRITCSIKMDWRKGRSGSLDSKVAKVEKTVGRKLKT
jgi:uncharacterized protein (TIGR00106 family)